MSASTGMAGMRNRSSNPASSGRRTGPRYKQSFRLQLHRVLAEALQTIRSLLAVATGWCGK